MIFSKTSEYAIRALAYLASDNALTGVQAVSKKIKAPAAYISKIFQGLVHAKILDSKRGATGGYYLRVAASELKLITIIRAIDATSFSNFKECVMGLSLCNSDHPCPLHQIWADAKIKMEQKLDETTLADIINTVQLKKSMKTNRIKLSKKMRKVFGQG